MGERKEPVWYLAEKGCHFLICSKKGEEKEIRRSTAGLGSRKDSSDSMREKKDLRG